MKNIIKLIVLTALLSFIASCANGDKKGHRDSSLGTSYELIVVCAQDKWEGELGDTLRAVLLEQVVGISQSEPLYDVLRILPNSFSDMLKKNRNIIIVQTDARYEKPAMAVQYDVYAAPQIVVSILGPDNKSVAEYVSEHRRQLQDVFEMAERDRSLALNKKYGGKTIEEQVKKQFGFTINFPKGYKIRNTIADKNFMWVSFEYPTASQGVAIYSYPYTERNDFTVEKLLEQRNEFSAMIPGENPGSHMTTYSEIMPEVKHLRIDGRYWAEMRGFWDVKNDFMGGPFVSYSTLDTKTNLVVTLDFYVYSPDKSKRNLLRGLEHLIYSVRFPGDEQVVATEQGEE